MRSPYQRTAAAVLACTWLVSLAALAGCAPPPEPTTGVIPTTTTASVAATVPTEPPSTDIKGPDATTSPPLTSGTTTTPPPKPKPKPPTNTVTRADAAAAIKKAVNAGADSSSDPRAKVTSVDVKVLAKADNGTWWVGAYLVNDLDGGIVFAKKPPGGSWAIIDLGTGIDGSEMVGKAPADIAAKFKAEFPQ